MDDMTLVYGTITKASAVFRLSTCYIGKLWNAHKRKILKSRPEYKPVFNYGSVRGGRGKPSTKGPSACESAAETPKRDCGRDSNAKQNNEGRHVGNDSVKLEDTDDEHSPPSRLTQEGLCDVKKETDDDASDDGGSTERDASFGSTIRAHRSRSAASGRNRDAQRAATHPFA